MLNIYTDKSFLTEKHRGKIFPLLLGLHYKYIPLVKDYYKIIEDINNADILILPLHVEYFLKYDKKTYSRFLELSKINKKPLWVYSSGDFGTTLKDDVYTFRCGGFNTVYNQAKTYIMPSFVADPYQFSIKDTFFKTISKKELPAIGFVGHADGSLIKWIKEFLNFVKYNTSRFFKLIPTDYQAFYPSSTRRYRLLKQLENSKKTRSNFIYRKKYRAGANNKSTREKTATEYFKNIYENPYTLCIRGVGNFSVRFYETLATGRIPVLIDTNCNLPLEEIIKWENHIVTINASEVSKLPDILNYFHKNCSEKDFLDMQENNRNLWINYFNISGYFREIHDLFIKSTK